MNFKDLQELLKLINKLSLSEFKMKDGEFELSIRTQHYEKSSKQPHTLLSSPPQQAIPLPAVQQTFAAPATPQTDLAPAPSNTDYKPTPNPGNADVDNYLEVKSPIVGTFYRSSSPDKPAYVKVGDVIVSGQTVCIVEAMKLFNEIESEISGKIVKVVVEDAQPVEYDQVLFLVDPNG